MAPESEKESHPEEPKSPTPKNSSAPSTRPCSSPSDHADKSQSVGHVVDEVVHGVKAAIDGVLSWAEDKVEGLSAKQDDTGPYSSPALCAPSDMDPIASGILPGMPGMHSEKTHENSQEETQGGPSGKVGNTDERERRE
ncbi:hypothetical protein J1614_011613 [Plenodomus biglobosus]|nr:hypothetical protein J1614_011613 [Plenodomus biglobosus]